MSKRRPLESRRLQDRDFAILEHLMTYRVTTRDVLHRLFFSDSDPNAVSKVTTRLNEGGFLTRHELIGSSVYFTLGQAGARMMGAPARSVEALGAQTLFTQIGILEFCCGAVQRRNRLSVSLLVKQHPEIMQKGADATRYVRDGSVTPSVLYVVRVDGGGPNDHVIRKIRNDLDVRIKNPLINSLIQSRRFGVACITYSEQKKSELDFRIQKEGFPCAVIVEVALILRDLQARFL